MAAEAMDALMKALTARGIEERDIQTTRFSIYPEYQYDRDKDRSELVGYRVNNQISVTIRNLDQVGMVIDDMLEAGGEPRPLQRNSFRSGRLEAPGSGGP